MLIHQPAWDSRLFCLQASKLPDAPALVHGHWKWLLRTAARPKNDGVLVLVEGVGARSGLTRTAGGYTPTQPSPIEGEGFAGWLPQAAFRGAGPL